MKDILLSGKVRGSALKFIPPKTDGGTKTVEVTFKPFGGIHSLELKLSGLEPTDAKDMMLPVDVADGEAYEIEVRLKPIARAAQLKIPGTEPARK